jgi:exonuclease SbcC
MKPIKLTMTAFGPFANTEVIEFNALGDKPLFLINGATGSGKTTILDGICFALYGKTTGDERQAAQMRCDYADVNSIAKVELVFELKGNQYRIVREPDQHRPKVRGGGFTKHSARAELYQVVADDDETLMVAAKVTEATKAIEDMTGLNVEQFRQVMVLPQGEFRRLLMADSADRQKVFSQLFQTHMYTRIESVLKDQSAGLRQELEALRNQQKGILGSADLTDEETLERELAREKPLLSAATAKKNAAQLLLDNAKNEHLTGNKITDDFARLRSEEQRLVDLSMQESGVVLLQSELARAHESVKLKSNYELVQRGIKELVQLEIRLKGANEAVAASDVELAQRQNAADRALAREPEVEACRSKKSLLESYTDRAVVFQKTRCEFLDSSKDFEQKKLLNDAQRKAFADAEKSQLIVGDELKSLVEKLKDLGNQQHVLSQLQQQFSRRQTMVDAEQELTLCRDTLASQHRDRGKASNDLIDCERTEQELELAWYRGQAAILARKLEDDQPCAVCGSVLHPCPATTDKAIPSEDQREQAKHKVISARNILNDIDKALSTSIAKEEHLLSNITALEKELGGASVQSLEELQKALSMHGKGVAGLERLASQEPILQRKLDGMIGAAEKLAESAKVCDGAAAEAATAMEVAKQAFETAKDEIPVDFRGEDALAKAIVQESQQLLMLQKLIKETQQKNDDAKIASEKTKTDLHHAMQAKTEAENQQLLTLSSWQQLLANSVFADESDYLSAIRKDEAMGFLQEKIQRFGSEKSELQGAINNLKIALDDVQQPNLAVLLHRVEACAEAFSVAEESFANSDKRYSQLLDVGTKLATAKQAAKTLEDRYAVIGTLSDVANGKTGNRVSLQRFVLSVLLDDVLVQASARLKVMSKGRYELYRQQEKGKGAGASGLDLVVEDSYNGKQRPVATLSGGESFMAALSLALGLSEVVQAYAGGIKLDTLFVDEGFGSLDPESLDLAVNTLIDLQSSGRMIGIISHVPELKERINIRLDVHSSRAGSTTSVVLA